MVSCSRGSRQPTLTIPRAADASPLAERLDEAGEFEWVDAADLAVIGEAAGQYIGAERGERPLPLLHDAAFERGHVAVGPGVSRQARAVAADVGLKEEHHVG